MSVTLTLYKVIPNVFYIKNVTDMMHRSDYDTKKGTIDSLDLPCWKKEAKFGAPIPPRKNNYVSKEEYWKNYLNWMEDYDKWSDSIKEWSDGKIYEHFDLVSAKEDGLSYKEYLYLKAKYNPTVVNTGFGYTTMNLPIDEVHYEQGWFFKERFFHRKNTVFITTSKDKMIKFLNYYIDKDYNSKHKDRHYDDLDTIISSFVEVWDDNADMIFECSF